MREKERNIERNDWKTGEEREKKISISFHAFIEFHKSLGFTCESLNILTL
jgi:hypothetical protein